MPTKTHGPLQEDYSRAIRAAKKAGAPAVRVTIGPAVIEIPLTDAYLKMLAPGQPPAPNTPLEKIKANW
jgi:hypothetical protein